VPAESGSVAPHFRSASSALVARSGALGALRNARATSAGGVVHRTVDGQVEIVLVHRRHPALWALPKGTPNAGETLEETALRETREETGLQVEIEAPIRAISYVFVRGRTRFHKSVHFYLMRAMGGALADHDHEFDEVAWLPVDEAMELMTHATERAVVEDAIQLLSGAASSSFARQGAQQ
jgi:8-oxo-dGTP pyrophosphatase MutT (NUDIX family)